MLRLAKGIINSKIHGRNLLPRDLWRLKGILAGGAGTAIYREKIKAMWGREPLDIYTFTEGGMIAVQTWDYQGMTFFPSLNFLEFIPEKESTKLLQDPTYKPVTLLLDEVQADENYELVITNFLGGAMVRYRVGDMVHITALSNEQLNIDIPQMVFYSRADNIIDIAGFTRLTEKTIWQAIENSGIAYKDWTARLETKEHPVLHIYIEPEKDGNGRDDEIAAKIHGQLVTMDPDYASVESLLGFRPVRVTLLNRGAFSHYTDILQKQSAKLGQLKPPHINPSDDVLKILTGNE